MSDTPPLVILAFDGADAEFLRQWAREGYLPTFQSILDRGCHAFTSGPELCSEHGIWVSLLSGVSHAEHGYYYFRQLRPGTYDLHAMGPVDAKAQPFWAELRGGGKRVAILDAPDTHPVPGLDGIQLANWASHQAAQAFVGPSSEPASLLPRVRKLFGAQMPVLEFKPDSTPAEDRSEYRLMMSRIEKKGELLRELLGRERYDVTVIGFFEAHAAAHRFWKYHPESPQSRRWPEAIDLSHAIRDVYHAIDREMGKLLQQLPADANVMIVTAFSMEDYYPTTELMESFCRELGYQAAPTAASGSSNGSRSFSPLALLRRAMPKWMRVAISNRLPRDVQERLLADYFRNATDWSRTTAFSIPGMYTGFIRVNLKGREPQGIVEPRDYDALLDRIEADFRQLVDPVDGQPAVKSVHRTKGTLCAQPPDRLPDLFVEWRAADYFFEHIVHPRAELRQRSKLRYHRDSYHSYEGLIAAAGPSIAARGLVGEISLLDVAPTLMSFIGERSAKTMSGTSAAERFTTDAGAPRVPTCAPVSAGRPQHSEE